MSSSIELVGSRIGGDHNDSQSVSENFYLLWVYRASSDASDHDPPQKRVLKLTCRNASTYYVYERRISSAADR